MKRASLQVDMSAVAEGDDVIQMIDIASARVGEAYVAAQDSIRRDESLQFPGVLGRGVRPVWYEPVAAYIPGGV